MATDALAPNLLIMMNDAATKAGNKVMAKVTHEVLNYHTSRVG